MSISPIIFVILSITVLSESHGSHRKVVDDLSIGQREDLPLKPKEELPIQRREDLPIRRREELPLPVTRKQDLPVNRRENLPRDIEDRKVLDDKRLSRNLPTQSAHRRLPVDEHEYCCFWAANNECHSNYRYMRTRCQKSCGTPGCTLAIAKNCRVLENISGCRYPPTSPKIWDAEDTLANLGALYRLLLDRVGVRV